MRLSLSLIAALTLAACATTRVAPPPAEALDMNAIAEQYVRLVLAVGEHDEHYVDAFYGPPRWREEVKAQQKSLPAIHSEAVGLLAKLGAPKEGETPEALRHTYLARQLQALIAWTDHLNGKRLPFDEESRALYDAVAPRKALEDFRPLLDELEALLPGEGPLHQRYNSYRARFVIPTDKLGVVFEKAIEACRTRTREHLPLPEGETFDFEFVTDKPWSGYNWYQGNLKSLIQVNTELPIYIDRAIDLACHEGYPGHHVYNVLLEQTLMRERGWIEFSVYPLYSPQSLIAEGSANYGVELTFPRDARVAYERANLFPLAGLDPAGAETYYRVEELVEQLGYAGNEAARRRLDDGLGDAETAQLLERYALMSPERAAQRVKFIDRYRAYVINYNLGKKLVADYVEAQGGPTEEGRWRVFTELLSSPRLPSALVAGARK